MAICGRKIDRSNRKMTGEEGQRPLDSDYFTSTDNPEREVPSMSSSVDITLWLQQLKAGDPQAAQPLWEKYFRRLVGLARVRLGSLPRGVADEEDVALSAFDSFCRRAAEGRFPRLDDRDDLWQVLVLIATRKAQDLREYEQRAKRNWHRRQPLEAEDASEPFGAEPDPAEAAQVAEETARLLGLLPDELMRNIAVRKLEGYTNKEIAGLLRCSLATVERRLPVIRELWERELPACGVSGTDAE
jgi:DNA-directed RNA polymerase specialized sigma24 family protein